MDANGCDDNFDSLPHQKNVPLSEEEEKEKEEKNCHMFSVGLTLKRCRSLKSDMPVTLRVMRKTTSTTQSKITLNRWSRF